MTHRDLFATHNHQGFAAEDCWGELDQVESIKDPVWDPRDGRTRDHLVTILRCDACRKTISVDVDTATILNQYPSPADLAETLAKAWQLPAHAVPVATDESN